MKFFILFVFLVSFSFGDSVLKIATYNVENLFDLEKSDFRYEEYKPYGKSLWNQKNYKIKLKNIAKVIKDIDADIIALQEIGSLKALKDLRLEIKRQGLYYQYFSIANKKKTVIQVALLSKIPFIYSKDLSVTSSFKYRNILETKFKFQNKEFYIFNNHWKAKSSPESMRVVSAKALKKRISQIGEDKNIILLGDFNSDYEEYIKFKRKRQHNDTHGKTGINHILKSIEPAKDGFYNLWYDAKEEERYSYIFKGKKEALDNILISHSLRNTQGVSYITGSIKNFNKSYLFKKKNIYRWQMSHGRIKKHKGKGYSDHLPVLGRFLFKS
ncbi:MAG: endonuclease/exonuclease/phosphatase family protein [Helicobacteraceae bacterium]|nr:endonuclease/exonuclease/phosphatase family protein [Candidatus Sulfurimonas ponti]MBL6973509.1 endonuclease/exonuclease/phosphatase family protein [Sulfurimonas sp.]